MLISGKKVDKFHRLSHSWFVGFAPADDPKASIAVIVENVGNGADIAAPLARQLILRALR